MNPDPVEDSPIRNDFKGRTGIDRVVRAAGYSIAGLRAAFRSEAAFRQLVLLNLVLLPVAFLLPVSSTQRALLVLVVLLTLIVELLNSSIEAAVDRISLEEHPLSGQAKDMGSAAQMVALVAAALVWAIILL